MSKRIWVLMEDGCGRSGDLVCWSEDQSELEKLAEEYEWAYYEEAIAQEKRWRDLNFTVTWTTSPPDKTSYRRFYVTTVEHA